MAKILVVDDEELIRAIVRQILSGDGHDIIEADDGDSCIACAREAMPDLIVLDMNMPKMTGFEVVPILRTHPSTRDIPVIALTADTATESIEAAHKAGCDHYLAKPIDAKKLLGLLDTLMDRKT